MECLRHCKNVARVNFEHKIRKTGSQDLDRNLFVHIPWPYGDKNDSKSHHTRQLESLYTTYAITSPMDRQLVDRTLCASASGWLSGSLQTPLQTPQESFYQAELELKEGFEQMRGKDVAAFVFLMFSAPVVL